METKKTSNKSKEGSDCNSNSDSDPTLTEASLDSFDKREEIYLKEKKAKILLYRKGLGDYPDSSYRQSRAIYDLETNCKKCKCDYSISQQRLGLNLEGAIY